MASLGASSIILVCLKSILMFQTRIALLEKFSQKVPITRSFSDIDSHVKQVFSISCRDIHGLQEIKAKKNQKIVSNEVIQGSFTFFLQTVCVEGHTEAQFLSNQTRLVSFIMLWRDLFCCSVQLFGSYKKAKSCVSSVNNNGVQVAISLARNLEFKHRQLCFYH